jgi:hypothetical protein
MSEASPSLTARRNRRRFSTRKVLLMLGVLVLMSLALSAGILSYYGYHLVWRFSGFQDVQSIPTSPMPDSPPPEDWLDCRFGPLELTLPPDLVESMDVVANDVIVILNSENESRSLMLVWPLRKKM